MSISDSLGNGHRYGLILLLLVLPLTAALAKEPQINPFEVHYLINRNGLPLVNMERRLIKTETGIYRFEANSSPTKNISWLIKDRITEYSLLQQNPLRPLQYRYERKGGRKSELIELEFDWQNNKARDVQHNPVTTTTIPAETTDKLLYQLQIMLDLAAGKRELKYTIVDKGKLHHYHYKFIGNEKLQLPIGDFETIVLHRDAGKRSTTIWCAPALNYLPVRIEHKEKDGSRMQANATHISGIQPLTVSR